MDNEERILREVIDSVENELKECEGAYLEATNRMTLARQRRKEARQAVVDYMTGNGLVETDCFKLVIDKTTTTLRVKK